VHSSRTAADDGSAADRPEPPPRGKARLKRAVSVLVSLGLLAAIYSRIDLSALGRVLATADFAWLFAGLGALLPIKLTQAWRLRELMPRKSTARERPLGRRESLRLILVADVMNMVLPSKMGDLAKAWFLRSRGHLGGSLALSLVVFEKAWDVLALLLWCGLGLLALPGKGAELWVLAGAVWTALAGGLLLLGSAGFARLCFAAARRVVPSRFQGKLLETLDRLEESWRDTQVYFREEPGQLRRVVALSVGLWLLHFLQLWIFILALNAWVPFLPHLALASLAILAGLVPLTFAGLGTRDAALIALYAPYFGPPTAAALGILFTSRYLLPALAGLPFFRTDLEAMRGGS
jgi:glycosyltransferase 2 family protein